MVIAGIQILSQTFTHDKIKTVLPFISILVMTKNRLFPMNYGDAVNSVTFEHVSEINFC
jgi:hypothetical protein